MPQKSIPSTAVLTSTAVATSSGFCCSSNCQEGPLLISAGPGEEYYAFQSFQHKA